MSQEVSASLQVKRVIHVGSPRAQGPLPLPSSSMWRIFFFPYYRSRPCPAKFDALALSRPCPARNRAAALARSCPVRAGVVALALCPARIDAIVARVLSKCSSLSPAVSCRLSATSLLRFFRSLCFGAVDGPRRAPQNSCIAGHP
jgi:hypothetical protein